MLRFFLSLVIITLIPSMSLAKNLHYWEDDRKIANQEYQNGNCAKAWEILWKWSKNGNTEARFDILYLLAPPPHMDSILIPTNHGDIVSTLKDTFILSVFSLPVTSSKESFRPYKDMATHLMSKFGIIPSKEYTECLQGDDMNNCIKIAISEGYIPSFKDYANVIDAYISTGKKAVCKTHEERKED